MKASSIGRLFLDYYTQRGYAAVAGSSLVHPIVPQSFVISAGLAQIDASDTGTDGQVGTKQCLRQKCFRHFDIERIGMDDIHLSLFDMPAAFRFGCVARAPVLEELWLLLTKQYGLDSRRLYITYLQGGERGERYFSEDSQTYSSWLDLGVSADQVVGLGTDSNLWIQGKGMETQSPLRLCGASTEIFWDRGHEQTCGEQCQPGCSCGRFIEIANVLFVDQHVSNDGVYLSALTAPFSETVIGTERVALVLQGKSSVFEIDSVAPATERLSSAPGYRTDSLAFSQMRVMVDHLRALIHLVADGAPPPWGNSLQKKGGRIRLMRMLIRRMLAAERVLEINDHHYRESALDALIENSEEVSRLRASREKALYFMAVEQKRFEKTLTNGYNLLCQTLIHSDNGQGLTGTQIATLEKAHGLPSVLIEQELQRRGLTFDYAGYLEAKQAWKRDVLVNAGSQ